MKKYIYLIFVLLLAISLQVSLKTYAYQECNNFIENNININSKDIQNYITKNFFRADVNYFCSGENCYYLKNETLNIAIDNYLKLQRKKLSEEYYLELEIKGFPITEISLNLCS